MSTAETESRAESDEFEVLQAIRCRGVAASERIAANTGLAAGSVEAVVGAAEESGFVKRRQGRVSGMSLTPSGRARLALLTRVMS